MAEKTHGRKTTDEQKAFDDRLAMDREFLAANAEHADDPLLAELMSDIVGLGLPQN